MSTIDPSLIDPTKPPDGSGDPNNPTNYEPVEERIHKTTVQGQFQAAKNDIEGLESGKADQSAFLSHVSNTSNPHAVTAAQANAVPDILNTDGELLSHDGVGYTKIGVGTDGHVLTSRPAAGQGLKVVWEPGGGGGSGDVTSTNNTAANEVQVGDDPAKGIKGAGFNGADVARRDVSNAFAAAASFGGDVSVDSNTLGVRPGSGSAKIDLWGVTGAPNNRYFSLFGGQTGGQFELLPVNDAGTPIAGRGMFFSHAGGMAVGNPTGGVPTSSGTLNVQALTINNVPVGTGGGDVSSDVSTSVNQELAVFSGTSGKLITTGGPLVGNVARLDVANTFAADQVLQQSGDVDLDLYQTGQFAESGRFRLQSSSGIFTITARNDAGAQAGNSLFALGHSNGIAALGATVGNAAFQGAGTLAAENGLYDGANRVLNPNVSRTTTVGYPFDITTVTGATATVDPSIDFAFRCTFNGDVNVDLANFTQPGGMLFISFESTVGAISFINGTVIADTSDPGTGQQRSVVLVKVDAAIYASWTPSG